jgi:hypothetical protein
MRFRRRILVDEEWEVGALGGEVLLDLEALGPRSAEAGRKGSAILLLASLAGRLTSVRFGASFRH